MVGRLIYLIGPSGSGKDSLLDAARETLARRDCRVVRRVITRSAEAVGEAAQAVTVEQFEHMRERGAFALCWQANGLRYGIPIEIDQWLLEGHDVLINGSRAHLQKAQARYPNLLAVLLTVNQDVLRQRLLARNRETLAEIEERLERNSRFAGGLMADTPQVVPLDNSADLQQTVATLIGLLDKRHACA
ncbi:phosphonate metabolism protein/1,5-bisphosphokinase (PRPP-forming) PhnN [Pseudomonas tremae]|uniref:phosphonate metabolism protein/1,5-bisphosphokinase (PRPP-forming) PhnN n=1 Tax=Pseudomonas tremae TaxID=200454 RepID=UPI0021086503|nr:phosphonate metabolism protein/1,5-bisphosphokinase (PRPP-forming) PhnN [Pseudomonas tremae]MCQ2990411.1 phosphonate metabolism protein/1,5-bisphosphokinase (PRPP-forming) PhnN [Pseudomonas tremae]